MAPSSGSAGWPYAIGASAMRAELHATVGGRPQGAISPSNVTPNILVFTDEADALHREIDGWQEDGCFHYAGEGKFGSQAMRQGNRTLRDHRQEGRAIRLFELQSGQGRYIGEFELDQQEPFYQTDAPDEDGEARTVFVFRLRPRDDGSRAYGRRAVNDRLPPTARAECKTIEIDLSGARPSRSGRGHNRESAESTLVRDYVRHLRQRGQHIAALEVRVPGERRRYRIDIFEPTTNRIIEAKADVTQEAAVQAVGQLFFISNIIPERPQLGVLFNEKPRPSLMSYFLSCCIDVIYRAADQGFTESRSSLRRKLSSNPSVKIPLSWNDDDDDDPHGR